MTHCALYNRTHLHSSSALFYRTLQSLADTLEFAVVFLTSAIGRCLPGFGAGGAQRYGERRKVAAQSELAQARSSPAGHGAA